MIIKNALISTTRGHNIGDEIIHNGVMRLLSLSGISIKTHILFNRNPDLQQGPFRHARPLTVGDYDNDIIFPNYDVIILAGSPECFGPPVAKLYEYALENDIPMWIIGAGSGTKSQPFTATELAVMRKPSTIITTRQQDLADAINAKLNQTKAKAFICPASFNPLLQNLPTKAPSIHDTLYIVQAPGRTWHKVNPRYLEGVDATSTIPLVCFHTTDFIGLGGRPILVNEVQKAMQKIAQFKTVVSTRLHGAIAALSMGIPAIVVGKGDYRIESAAAMFNELLPVAQSFSQARELTTATQRTLVNFINDNENNYSEWLRKEINENFKA